MNEKEMNRKIGEAFAVTFLITEFILATIGHFFNIEELKATVLFVIYKDENGGQTLNFIVLILSVIVAFIVVRLYSKKLEEKYDIKKDEKNVN